MSISGRPQIITDSKPLLKKREVVGSRKKKFTKKDRFLLAGLFALTVLASTGVYLWAKIPLAWVRLTSPLVISTVKQEKKFDAGVLTGDIQSLLVGKRGSYGLFVYRFGDENSYGIRIDEVFPSASLVKLAVLVSLYQRAEDEKIDLAAKYQLRDQDKVGGAGILQAKKAGTNYTYRQLAEYMGQYSDNTAYGILVRVLGQKNIQDQIMGWGLNKTSLAEYETSPSDMGLLLRKLYAGELVSAESRDEILGFLTKTAFEDWIPAGVPSNIRVAHKIGRDLGTFSDAGVVFAEKPFILVIMSKDAKESEVNILLPEITKLVWEWEKADI